MGTRSSTPDLFSLPSNRSISSGSANPSSPSVDKAAIPASVPRYVLPTNLPHAMKQLEDNELDRLLSAVIAEQHRRGKKLAVSNESSRKRQITSLAVPLTQGKVNAVRAAFKAGVTPSRIARQFGISQSDVRKALVGSTTKE
jgi:hypothetical protein